MKLSERRRQAIYNAVHEELMQLRIRLSQYPLTGSALDERLFQAQCRAASAAVAAAEQPLRRGGAA